MPELLHIPNGQVLITNSAATVFAAIAHRLSRRLCEPGMEFWSAIAFLRPLTFLSRHPPFRHRLHQSQIHEAAEEDSPQDLHNKTTTPYGITHVPISCGVFPGLAPGASDESYSACASA